MRDKAVTVLCVYSADHITAEKLICESFRSFLKRELFQMAVRLPVRGA
ncbi:MAG: hypothetical protein J5968_01195 [Oscillospiraceae bacterium]|nr:hypothetical protein [Oscillospiraceae bacterium]MBP1576882.1 hypothetical protein [Oscillospiraceae bacterium]